MQENPATWSVCGSGVASKPTAALRFAGEDSRSIRLRQFILILAVLMGMCVPGMAQAQYLDSSRGAGMGAVRGDPVGSSAVIYNPAGLSRALFYSAEAQYFRAQQERVNVAGITIVDSRTQPQLAVGVAYGYQFSDKSAEIQHNGQDVKLALAHAVIPERFHVGFGFRYVAVNRTYGDLEDADDMEMANMTEDLRPNLEALEGFTVDAGLLFSPSRSFHIGVVGHNLVDVESDALPVQAGGGIAYTGNPVVLALDGLADFSRHPDGVKPVLAGGLEVLLGRLVPFRLGYKFDGVGTCDEATNQCEANHWVSGGIGFMSAPRGGKSNQLTISYKHNITEPTEINVGLGLIFFL